MPQKVPRGVLLANRAEAWKDLELPQKPIPSMLSEDERRYLRFLGTQLEGVGEVVDLGPLAGASTQALLVGMSDNPQARGRRVHAFDLWEFYPDWADLVGRSDLGQGDDISNVFIGNLLEFEGSIVPSKGNLDWVVWGGSAIEVLFIDAAKSPETMQNIVKQFYPSLIPGKSIVVQQDWVSAEVPWVHISQMRMSEFFAPLESPHGGSVAFRLMKELPDGLLRPSIESIDEVVACQLLVEAADLLVGWPRLCVELARSRYLALHGRIDLARRIIANVKASADMCEAVDYDVRLCELTIEQSLEQRRL